MIFAWSALGETAPAKKAAERILKLQMPDGLFRHGEGLRPLLGDQAQAARALLALRMARATKSAAQRALSAAQQKWTAPSGALHDGDPLPEGLLKERQQPILDNAVFAQALGGAAAKKILEAFGGSYLQHGTEAATWALAVSSSRVSSG